MKPIKSVTVASLVASMFAAGCGVGTEGAPTSTSKQAVVKCAGINSCSGQGACAGTLGDGGTHDCAGKNSCAGQGWIEVPESECDSKGGTVVK
jgi:hypothetical protein